MVKTLKSLFKFGIVVFVLISAIAGYGIGLNVEDRFSFAHFMTTMLGIFFISSGSLALNQVQEIEKDRKMERTSLRPIPSGKLSKKQALIISSVHIILGLLILYFINPLSSLIGILIIILYNGPYTLHWKTNWAFGAVPGAVPGALPGVLGFSAVNNNIFSSDSLYLFFVMFLWQMPHFWTLAIRYRDDYAKGGFPILPVKLGKHRTIYHISFYVFAYALLAIFSPFFVSYHIFYFILVIPFALFVVYQFIKYASSSHEKAWLPFFLWTNFSLLAFLYAPLFDKWGQLYLNVYRYY